VAVVLESFNGLGVGAVVVRQHDLNQRQLSGLFWFSTLLGGVAVGAMVLAGPPLAVFYGDERLAPMIIVSSLKLVFVGASLVPLQLLARDLRFRESGAAQTLASLGEAVTKVVLILAGFGPWGLVVANVARGLFLLLALLWLSPFRPLLALSIDSTLRAVRFGLRVTTSSVLYNAYRNADFLLIGRVLGKEALGLYRIAFDLGMTPLEIVRGLVVRVQFPIYAKLQAQPEKLRDTFYRSAWSLLLLLGPVAALICFGSPDLLRLVGGGRWIAAVPLVQVLCWASLLRGLAELFPQLYVATGHPELTVFDTLIAGGTLVSGFALVLALLPPATSLLAVAWVWLLSYPVVIAAHFVMVRRCAAVTITGWMRAVAPAIFAVAAMAASLAAGSLLRSRFPSPLVSLVFLIGLGLIVFSLYLHRVLHLRLRDLLPSRR
jgi:O-antigen/teichoic acid export membrane protein